MGKITPLYKTIGMVMLILSLLSCKSSDMTVVVEEPTRVYKNYPESGPPNQNEVITVLNKGETGIVIHSRYAKDAMYYKIRLKDGRKGYVMFGDKFRVEKK
jgi:uncharacterized protein YgiM (DUF1202 family)